jgi:hypothetical protein
MLSVGQNKMAKLTVAIYRIMVATNARKYTKIGIIHRVNS